MPYTLGMPDRSSRTKRLADPNELAYSIVQDATGQKEKNPAAVVLGRLGGLKGGRARAEKLSARKRKAIAQKAAKSRWEKRKKPQA